MLVRQNLDEISKILLDAANYIEKHGHTKWTRKDDQGRVCALGALDMVIYGETMDSSYRNSNHKTPAVIRLSKAIEYDFSTYALSDARVAYWNNHEERTQQEVIDKFREVAYDPQYALAAL